MTSPVMSLMTSHTSSSKCANDQNLVVIYTFHPKWRFHVITTLCKPWFLVVPIGKHTLAGMMKTMCTEAGLPGSYTNHSLRASGATALFTSGVPEALVQHCTGH